MRLSFLSIIILSMCFGAYSQQCTPNDTISVPGIYPNYVDTATVGDTYEHVLQILAVQDTNVVFAGQTVSATIDSIKIADIEGLPSSFGYGCEPSNCVYTYENVGCAVLSGNPTASDMGEHPLDIYIVSYARIGTIKLSVTDTIDNFVLVVADSNTSSVGPLQIGGVKLIPNPSNGDWLKVVSPRPIEQLAVHDEAGRLVLDSKAPQALETSLYVRELPKGVYFIRLTSAKGEQVLKWIRT